MPEWVVGLSQAIHDLIYSDKSQSLCARAWEKQGGSLFWRMWVWVFGRDHCRLSYDWHNQKDRE